MPKVTRHKKRGAEVDLVDVHVNRRGPYTKNPHDRRGGQRDNSGRAKDVAMTRAYRRRDRQAEEQALLHSTPPPSQIRPNDPTVPTAEELEVRK